MKIAIIVGHSLTKPGAYGVDPLNCYEYEWYKPFAQELYRLARGLNLQCHVFTRDGLTIEKVGEAVNKWAGDDNACAIELHWNSLNGNIQGTETWFDLEPPEGELLAKEVHNAMIGLFNRRDQKDQKKNKLDRGTKLLTDHDRGFKNAATVKIPYALIEPVFADNKIESKLLLDKRVPLAMSLISAAHKFLVNQSSSAQLSYTGTSI